MRLAAATAALTLALVLPAAGCRQRPGALMSFDAAAATSAPAPPTEEPNQIHFTITGPRSVTFDWVGNGRTLRYWAKDVPPHTVMAHPPTPLPVSSPGPWQEADLTELAPGVEYEYVIGSPARPIPNSFRAPPAPGPADFTFAAMGDVGASADWPQVQSMQRLVGLAEPAFVLMLGDLTYADVRARSSVDRHFEDVMAWSRRAAYMPVWGNHEWEDSPRDDLRNYKGRFALPNPQASPGAPAAGCCGEDWYWFDYGNVRFIIYPEPYGPRTWDDWAARAEPLFAQAQRDPALAFVVTAGHRPAYSSGREGGDPRLRRILDGFGARYSKYVLNLNGHSHVYERTKPQAHVVHITAGIGGGALEHARTACLWPDCTPPPFTAFRAIHHGFLRLVVSPESIRVEAMCGVPSIANNDIRCGEGEIMDQLTIARPRR